MGRVYNKGHAAVALPKIPIIGLGRVRVRVGYGFEFCLMIIPGLELELVLRHG